MNIYEQQLCCAPTDGLPDDISHRWGNTCTNKILYWWRKFYEEYGYTLFVGFCEKHAQWTPDMIELIRGDPYVRTSREELEVMKIMES